MAALFDITAASNTVVLKQKTRQGEASFTVTNLAGRLIRGRAVLVALDPVAQPWLTVVDEAERRFPISGSQQYTVQIAAPMTAPARDYIFRLNMVDAAADFPEETITTGPSVTFTVPEAPPPPPKRFPWWIIVVAVVVILVIIGVIVALVTRPRENPVPTDTPAPVVEKIVFYTVNESATGTSITIIDINGQGRTNLSVGPSEPEDPPAWSPDGRQIAFASDHEGDVEIYVVNADGSGQKRLTNTVGGDFTPAWSPDGRQIAFSSRRSGNVDIYVMNADGSGQARITSGSGSDSEPAWSPDGRQIVFSSGFDIFVMNADGTGQVNLTDSPTSPDGNIHPAWSPDGNRIVFVSQGVIGNAFFVVSPDGSQLKKLTEPPQTGQRPVWSPDGRQFAFMSGRDGNAEIYVMNADGNNQRNLTQNPADDDLPAWSPDGRQIAFTSDRDGNLEVYVMNADGSEVKNITRNAADEGIAAWQPNN